MYVNYTIIRNRTSYLKIKQFNSVRYENDSSTFLKLCNFFTKRILCDCILIIYCVGVTVTNHN